MCRLTCFVMTLGLAVVVPSAVSAAAPTAARAEKTDPDRPRLQEAIVELRAALRQMERSACRQEAAEQEVKRTLWELERAYANHLRSPIRLR